MPEALSWPPKEVVAAILALVDTVVPDGESVWLTGSRVRGNAKSDSDWDVVAFSKSVSRAPSELFKSNHTSQHAILGGKIELVIAHPDHWNDPRRYMTDLRQSGLRLR
jgi:predicted nucleotidyltransferase